MSDVPKKCDSDGLARALDVENIPVITDPETLLYGDIVHWRGMDLRYIEQIASHERIQDDHLFGYIFEPTDDEEDNLGPEWHLTVSQVRAARLVEG